MLLSYKNASLFFKGESDVSSVLCWTVYIECLHQHLRKIIPIITFLKVSFVFSGKNIRSLWKLMVCLVTNLISALYRHFFKCCAVWFFYVVIIPSGSCEVKKPLKTTGGPSHLLAHQPWLVKGVMSQWTKPELQLQAFPGFRRPRLQYTAGHCCRVIKLLPAI